MRSGYDVKEDHSIWAMIKSFKYATTGILTSVAVGRNIKVHYVVALLVVCSGFYFNITPIEWCLLLLVISQVITLEMINTAIERVVDLASPDYHLLAKIAKDVAAGAVLMSAAVAVIIGLIIYMPYILN
ncbi:MAG: diacylglycerol kinase family protein [Turicibacter sp.]